MLVGEEQHLRQWWVQRELDHAPSQLRQISGIVDGAQYPQLIQRRHDVILGRWIHEIEIQQVLHPQRFEQQHHVAQVRPLYFGDGRLHQFLSKLTVGVKPETESRTCPARPSRALAGIGPAHRCDVERIHAYFGIVYFELAESRVNDILDSIHGQTRLRHVRRNDALPDPLRRRVENLGLQIGGQLTVHWQNQQRLGIMFVSQALHLLREDSARPLDVLLTRHEYQYVPGRAVEVYLERLLHGCHDVILLHTTGEVRLHRERAPRYPKHRDSPEEVREDVCA
mmetsp:Transcript_28820/g.69421  ORF Transcript_28820/g.69421 Transcript_28820/m.69421 type:complete len:282 (-) Transcript_28820:249-1094(-)